MRSDPRQLQRQHHQVLEESAKVSEDFLKKHPKGLGVEPRRVKGREVTEVLLLPVSHLGDFYQSKNAENRLGSGANKDYNQFTQSEDVILGDIVRKASSGGVSRAYLRARAAQDAVLPADGGARRDRRAVGSAPASTTSSAKSPSRSSTCTASRRYGACAAVTGGSIRSPNRMPT